MTRGRAACDRSVSQPVATVIKAGVRILAFHFNCVTIGEEGASSNGLLIFANDPGDERPESLRRDEQRPLLRRWCLIADDSGNRRFLWSTYSPGGEGCEPNRHGRAFLKP